MKVYLTIDDGPSPLADRLITCLESKGLGAVMFCRGDNLVYHAAAGVRAIRAGFILGNHSFDHPHFQECTDLQAAWQIKVTDQTIERLYAAAETRRPAKYFRFPYGEVGSAKTLRLLSEFGYRSPVSQPQPGAGWGWADGVWGWIVDVEDWHVNEANVQAKMAYASERLKTLSDGDVLDLHDQEANIRLGLFENICETASQLGISFHNNDYLASQAARTAQL